MSRSLEPDRAARPIGQQPAVGSDMADAVSLPRRLVAEGLGTAMLTVAVVGSGILAERLASGNAALALLASALATGAALFALIVWFAPISGAHLNPLVTAMLAARGELRTGALAGYVAAQIAGALAGVVLANVMFDAPAVALATSVRLTPANWLGEVVSTFGLAGAVWSGSRLRPEALPGVVAAYVAGGFFFTPTGFANPAITFARGFTDTFAGIGPAEGPFFIAAEIVGTLMAGLLFSWLVPAKAGEPS